MLRKSQIRYVVEIAAVVVLAATAAIGAQTDIQVRASASPAQLTLADTLEYRVEVSGPSLPGRVEPQVADFAALGFVVLQGPSSMQSTVINNLEVRATLSYWWALRPTREGTFEIGPASVLLPGGKVIRSNSVRVVVGKAAAVPVAALPANLAGEEIFWAQTGDANLDRQLQGRIFLRPVIDKTEAFVGERITLTYEFYQASDLTVHRYGIERQSDQYRGFTTEMLYQPPSGRLEFRRQTIGGVAFQVATAESVALFANKTGPVTIPPMVVTAQIPVRVEGSPRRRPRSVFDDPFFDGFFADPFGSQRTVDARLVTRPITIQILPLPPEGKPADFTGTVGDYRMAASFDRNEINQYDLVTLRVQFTGMGQMDAISPPAIPVGPPDRPGNVVGLQRHKEQSSSTPVGFDTAGTKAFEFILRAAQSGEIKFPALQYALFNPRLKRYETLRTDPLMLRVSPASQGASQPVQVYAPPAGQSSGQGPAAVVEIQPGIQYIRTRGFLSRGLGAVPLYQQPEFLLFQILPVAMVVASLAVRRRRDRLAGNAAEARRRLARSVASKRLRKARKLLSAEQSGLFFEELDRALRQFVADHANESAVGLTAERIAQVLVGCGVEGNDVGEMFSLLDSCQAARYSATRPDQAQMRQVFQRASDLVARLARSMR